MNTATMLRTQYLALGGYEAMLLHRTPLDGTFLPNLPTHLLANPYGRLDPQWLEATLGSISLLIF